MNVADEGNGKVAVNSLVGLDIDGPHDLMMADPGADSQEQPSEPKSKGAVIDGNRPLPKVIVAHELCDNPQQEPRNEEHRRIVRKGKPIAGKAGQPPRYNWRQHLGKDVRYDIQNWQYHKECQKRHLRNGQTMAKESPLAEYRQFADESQNQIKIMALFHSISPHSYMLINHVILS